jgi:hypothetical protein
MSVSKSVWMCLLITVIVFGNRTASAIPVRQSSSNGQGGDVDSWTVLGRTVVIPLSAGGKKVTMTRQIICASDTDRSDGGCASGIYIYLFQLQSTSSNVTVNIGKLAKGSFTGNFYGVNICDDEGNDQELCTEDSGETGLSGITFAVKSKTAVSFTVQGAFPSFPAGVSAAEGQGLTFFIQTQQSSSLPIVLPSIGIQ